MKASLREDGTLSINMKLEIEVGVHELTMHALHRVKDEPSPVSLLLGCNKREVFALARDNILHYGVDVVDTVVQTRYSVSEIDTATELVTKLFPELLK